MMPTMTSVAPPTSSSIASSCCERAPCSFPPTSAAPEFPAVNKTWQKATVRACARARSAVAVSPRPAHLRSSFSPSPALESGQFTRREGRIFSSGTGFHRRHSCCSSSFCTDLSCFSSSSSSCSSSSSSPSAGSCSFPPAVDARAHRNFGAARREKKLAIIRGGSAMASAEKTVVGDIAAAKAAAVQPHLFPYPDGVSNASLSEFVTMDELSSALATYIMELSGNAIKERGSFTVVLSGGSLVKALEKLTVKPASDSIDWSKWHVFWADERHVPLSHPDSNYKLAKEGLLSKVPIPESQVYALDDSLDVEGAAQAYESVLRSLAGDALNTRENADGLTYPCFDLILLGMGPDGHIASLFPNHPLLAEKERWVMPIKNSPKPPPERITLTLPVINSAEHVAFVATGRGKAEVLQRILEVQALPGALPAQMVRPYEGAVVWFVDNDAISQLSLGKWADPKHFPRTDLKAKK